MPKLIYISGVEGVRFSLEGRHREYAKPDVVYPEPAGPFYFNAIAHGDVVQKTEADYDAYLARVAAEEKAKGDAQEAQAKADAAARAAGAPAPAAATVKGNATSKAAPAA